MVFYWVGQVGRGLGMLVAVVGLILLIYGFGPCLKTEAGESLCAYRCAVMGLNGQPFPKIQPSPISSPSADLFGFILGDWRGVIKGSRHAKLPKHKNQADMSNDLFLATALKAVAVGAPDRFWGTRVAVLLALLQLSLFVAAIVRALDTTSSFGDRVLVVYPTIGIVLAITTAAIAILWGSGQPYSEDPTVYAPFIHASLYLTHPTITNTGWTVAGWLFIIVAACFGIELFISLVLYSRHAADRAWTSRTLAEEADWNREDQVATIDVPVTPSSRALPTELGPPFLPTNANLLHPSPSSQTSPASPASGTPQPSKPYPQSPSAYPQSPSSLPVNPQSPSAKSPSAQSPSAVPKSPSSLPKSPSALPKESPSAINPEKESSGKDATEETSVKTTENRSGSTS